MRPETLFISDLHLSVARPEVVRRFLAFLDGRAAGAAALYVLGDLFDAYIGDDDNGEPNRSVKAALRRLVEGGTAVWFQHGNRDFLLGERFARETGISLLGDYAVVDLYGEPTLLTHGDLLCTDDVQYQAARLRVRSPEWQANALGKPLWMRRLYARWYRLKSGYDKKGKTLDIMDVNAETVRASVAERNVRRLIHGHTHRPGRYQLDLAGGQSFERIVLPEWAGAETLLCVSAEGYRVEPLEALAL